MEPLPEIGLISPKDTTSGGKSVNFKIGDIKFMNISKVPELVSIFIANIRPIKDGAIDTVDFMPSKAPDKKTSKIWISFIIPKAMIINIIIGKI